MSERVMLLGHLQERKLEANRLETKCRGLRDSLRSLLDRWQPIEQLATDMIAQQALELAAAQELLRGVQDEVAAIKRDLGE